MCGGGGRAAKLACLLGVQSIVGCVCRWFSSYNLLLIVQGYDDTEKSESGLGFTLTTNDSLSNCSDVVNNCDQKGVKKGGQNSRNNVLA